MSLALALLLDAVFGEPKWLWDRVPHPAVIMGNAIAAAETRMNRSPRRLMGVLMLVLLVLLAGGTGALIAALPLGEIWSILCAAILLAQRSLAEHVLAVASALRVSIEDGRQSVAMIVGRDVTEMNESGVARAAIESAAENLSDGVIAPAFWFLVAGLPGIFIYKAINTADSMVGYRNPRYEEFGWASARLDDLVNWIPARLTAGLILACRLRFDLIGKVHRDARLHRSPNAGWPETAMAGLMDIALSGPRSYDGRVRDFPFVNSGGRRDLNWRDIERCVTILWGAWGILFGGAVLAAIVN